MYNANITRTLGKIVFANNEGDDSQPIPDVRQLKNYTHGKVPAITVNRPHKLEKMNYERSTRPLELAIEYIKNDSKFPMFTPEDMGLPENDRQNIKDLVLDAIQAQISRFTHIINR